jgi:hypothetical protein
MVRTAGVVMMASPIQLVERIRIFLGQSWLIVFVIPVPGMYCLK